MSSVRFRLVRVAAAVGVAAFVASLGGPASAGKRTPVKVVDPVTMGALQIVNVIDGDAPLTVSVGGRIRARGVPALDTTAPVVVPSGVVRVDVGSAGVVGSISVDVPAGSRRTMFVLGRADAPRVAFVDGPEKLAASPAIRLVDLRSAAARSVVEVDGVARKVDANGISAWFTAAASPRVVVTGVSSTPDIGPGTSLVFVTERGSQTVATSVRQELVGLDSLRSPAIPVLKVHQSPVRLLGALALVISATIAALSSMSVFRARSRDDRTRGLMAKSFVL